MTSRAFGVRYIIYTFAAFLAVAIHTGEPGAALLVWWCAIFPTGLVPAIMPERDDWTEPGYDAGTGLAEVTGRSREEEF